MANLKDIAVADLAEWRNQGYTILAHQVVDYDDREGVVVPDSRYLDIIECERKFNQPYTHIAEREEVVSYLVWKRLSRHEDNNERPQGTFDEWLKTVVRADTKFRVDLDEVGRVPLAKGQEASS